MTPGRTNPLRFRIEHTIGENAEKMKIDLHAYEDKLVYGPATFKVKYTPRSQQRIDLTEKELRDAKYL